MTELDMMLRSELLPEGQARSLLSPSQTLPVAAVWGFLSFFVVS
jgi:hypothetical protein